MSILLDNPFFVLIGTNPNAKITGVQDSLAESPERDLAWYQEQFYGQAHYNFLCLNSPRGPLAVSIVEVSRKHYHILVRTASGNERITIEYNAIPVPLYRRWLGLKARAVDILEAMKERLPVEDLIKCSHERVPAELVTFEEKQIIKSYKFGVGYLAPGQSTELEMLSNTHGSPEFDQFLCFLGERIELKGWKHYRAGLDTKSDQSGKHSVYTQWHGYEIMFHVSVMLPHHQSDAQQLEKKRHIGNDIVLILFRDSDRVPFRMSSIRSRQNHIVLFVTPDSEGYRISMATKQDVPPFGPDLPEPPVVKNDPTSRDFLFSKLINGERASYRAPVFANKIKRTRSVLLYDIAERHLGTMA